MDGKYEAGPLGFTGVVTMASPHSDAGSQALNIRALQAMASAGVNRVIGMLERLQ
jgi:hypothetical protein